MSMRYYLPPFLSFAVLSCSFTLLFGQAPSYYEAKVKFKGNGVSPYIRWIRLYSEDGESDVYLKHLTKDPEGQGLWYLIDDPGGSLEVLSPDSGPLWAKGSRGQIKIEVEPYQAQPEIMRLAMRSDTFYLTKYPADSQRTSQEWYLYRLIKEVNGESTPITLLELSDEPLQARYLSLKPSDQLHDLPPLAVIVSVLYVFGEINGQRKIYEED